MPCRSNSVVPPCSVSFIQPDHQVSPRLEPSAQSLERVTLNAELEVRTARLRHRFKSKKSNYDKRMLKTSGVVPVRLPPRSPNLNAYAERWIGSVRRECLARVIPLGERHLRQIVQEYVEHYHRERPHQSLGNKLIVPTNDNAAASGRVARRQRLGGLLNYYRREAA